MSRLENGRENEAEGECGSDTLRSHYSFIRMYRLPGLLFVSTLSNIHWAAVIFKPNLVKKFSPIESEYSIELNSLLFTPPSPIPLVTDSKPTHLLVSL